LYRGRETKSAGEHTGDETVRDEHSVDLATPPGHEGSNSAGTPLGGKTRAHVANHELHHRKASEVDGVRVRLQRDVVAEPTRLLMRIGKTTNAGKQTDILVRRNGQELHINVTPQKRGERGMIGIFFGQRTKTFKPGPLEAVKLSVERNIEFGGLIFKTLGGLFVGTTSPRQLMGPVAIAQLSGESAALGLIPLLTLLASISLNLGVLNLMPIPVLDGGHIAIMALEGIARRDFSAAVKEKMLLAGFVLILLLMVTVIYNDLTRISWIERLMPWRN